MAYTNYAPTTWEDRNKAKNIAGTKLTAENMNKIESGISALEGALTTLAGQITPDQLIILNNVSTSLIAVQDGLKTLTEKFNAHVHSNVVGETTGEIV